MLKLHASNRSHEGSELLRAWALPDGTQCVLTSVGPILELQLVSDGIVLRRAHYIDIRPACEAARQWRLDYEIERESRWELNARILCPECGDEAFLEQPQDGRARWLRCGSCGDVWMIGDADERTERDS